MKVLVADDNPTLRRMLGAILNRRGFEVVFAENGEEAWHLLQEAEPPKMALLDWEMPGANGPEICRRVRVSEAGQTSYTYLLLLTSRNETQDIVAGMDAGADDYVVKPFDSHELQARLRAGQRIVELQDELRRLQEEFRRQSRTDPLTGCLNRRAILERLQAELARSGRDSLPLGVALLDIDHFKQVNDTHGHPAGDRVLCELVRRLTHGIRVSDTFGRMGGEEFLMLWPAANVDGARIAATRVCCFIQSPPFSLERLELTITVSVGITVGSGAETVEAVIARADEALYSAKANGRNRVELA